jgi:hypothetical protein
MKRSSFVLGALAILAFGGEVQAQEIDRQWRIIPSLGSYLPTGDLGFGRGPNDGPESPEFLNLSRGFAVGLAVEAPIFSAFSLRGGVKYGFASDLVAGNFVGSESCGANCGYAVYDRTPLTDASALLLSGDLVVRPAPSEWSVQPFVFGGLAFRRHFYEASVIPAGSAAIGAEEQAWRWVPHLGAGAEMPFRAVTLRVEAEIFGDMRLNGVIPNGGRYGDAFISMGLSWTP